MIHYIHQDFASNGESYKYRLTKRTVFVTNYDLGIWELVTPAGDIVAECIYNNVIVYPDYMWDGSTVVGAIYEDEMTLEASLLHDVLYNAKKNPDDIKVNFTLFLVDKIFRDELKRLYKEEGNWFQRNFFPNLYMVGLWVLGLPWKFSNNGYYQLRKG